MKRCGLRTTVVASERIRFVVDGKRSTSRPQTAGITIGDAVRKIIGIQVSVSNPRLKAEALSLTQRGVLRCRDVWLTYGSPASNYNAAFTERLSGIERFTEWMSTHSNPEHSVGKVQAF
jgi:hypothetical protein